MRIWPGGDRKSLYYARVAVAVALACLMAVGLAEACSCNPTSGGVREAVANADVVFRGTIIDIHDAKRDVITDILQPAKRIAVFRVTRVWKGDVGQTFEMPAIENPGGICRGFRRQLLVIGNELLVYAYEYKGEYLTGICSRTRLAQQSKEDFDELGEGSAPAKRN
jgi:hypothetical protein